MGYYREYIAQFAHIAKPLTYSTGKKMPNVLVWGDAQEQGPVWQCTASVCSGSALHGDLLGVSRSREGDLLSVLLVYHFLVRIHCVSSHGKDSLSVTVFCYMLMCVRCFGLVVSNCQVIGCRKTPQMTPS